MRRGTNPVLTFELPEAITISALYITFQQNRQTVLEKDLTAVTYDKENGIITLPLSQEASCSPPHLKTQFGQVPHSIRR